MRKVLLAALVAFCLLTPLVFCSCGSQQESPISEGFAIYLTKDDIPVSQMEMLSHVVIADEPVVSIDDIISYTARNHEIKLTPDAYERVMGLKVPTSGKSFVVCVDKSPVYWGAFWTPVSSQSFDGVTIWVPSFNIQKNTIKLELGYPSPGFFTSEDPRASPDIMQSLEQAGKLE
ncbi:MAG: hypothetical protein JXA17_06540 [Dehalococcoidales bacterium]|nr:hypothetical protein [Dehalococcoidales bacterium]